jgi:glycogen(starch) synthase
MRVLMTADTVGGVWTYALELAAGLAQRGVETVLATMGAALADAQREAAERVPGLRIAESAYRLEWMEDPWDDVARAGEWLLRLRDRVQPDLVHLNGYAHGALDWGLPVLVAGHSCVLSWWRAVRGEDAPPEWDRYRRAVRAGLEAADLVAAPTMAMLAALAEHYGPLGETVVIPNGASAEAYGPGCKEPFVFTAGRVWDEAKNIAALEEVAPRLSWPVYVAGQQHHPEGGYRRPVGLRGLGPLSRQELAAWLARAAVYAAPARYEPFGLSALEAGLSGCALVLGDIPSLREVWGNAALFVPPEDTALLEGTLAGLIDDIATQAAYGVRARRRAVQYGVERMTDGYTAAYRRLLNAGALELARSA